MDSFWTGGVVCVSVNAGKTTAPPATGGDHPPRRRMLVNVLPRPLPEPFANSQRDTSSSLSNLRLA